MKAFKSILIIFITILISYSAKSQTKWSLQQCIEYGYTNNIQLKQQNLNTKYSENNYLQSKTGTLPNLNAGSDYNLNFGRSVDPYTNEFTDSKVTSSNFYVQSSVTLFEGFKRTNTIKKSKLDLMTSIQDYDKLKNDLALNIATAYLQILFNKEMLKTAENQFQLSTDQAVRIEKLVNAGQLPQGNYLEILAQNASDELQFINSKNQLENSYLTLKQILDIKDSTAFDIVEPEIGEIIPILPYTIDEVYNSALGLPQIKSAELKLSASETELAISRSGYSPKLVLNATYATGFSDARKSMIVGPEQQIPIGFVGSSSDIVYSIQPTYTETEYLISNQLSDNANKSLGLRLSIPLFNGYMVKTNVQNSKISALNNQLVLENEKNNLYKDIQKAFFDVQSASAKFVSSNKALKANEEAFTYTEKKFNLGLLNTSDYNLAKNNLMTAKSNLIQAKYEYLFKKSILEFYAGKPIKIGNTD